MALVETYYFSSDGPATVPTSSDVQIATVTTATVGGVAGVPVSQVGPTVFPVALKDEFSAALDEIEADTPADGTVDTKKTLGDEGDFTTPFSFDVKIDATGAPTGIRMPNQTADWTIAKARDFISIL